jgi:hypothetical protein
MSLPPSGNAVSSSPSMPPPPGGGSPPPNVSMPSSPSPVPQSQDTSQKPDFDQLMQGQREIFRQRQLLKKEQQAFMQQQETAPRPKTLDDLLEELAPPKKVDPQMELEQRVKEQAKKEVMEELRKEREAEQGQQQEAEIVNNFTESVGQKLQEMQDKFPLAASTGMHKMASEQIMKDLLDIEDKYGDEYGEQWLQNLDVGKYFQKVEQTMAGNLQNMLKNPHVQKVVMKFLQGQPQGDAPQVRERTLSQNQIFDGGGQDLKNMSFEQRVAFAKQEFRNGRLGNQKY